MADSAIAISAGSGTNVDTRTETTNGNHRQVVVLGDPATNDGIAPVDATAGLTVNLGTNNDVTLATLPDTSGGDLATLSGAVSGTEMQVDVVAALPAGTNAIGKLAANSGVDIGDVDVTSIIPGTTATSLGKAEDAAHTTGDSGVFVLGVRNDNHDVLTTTNGDYAPVSVNDSGMINVNLAQDELAIASTLSTIDADTSSLAGTVGGTELQVDVVGALPAGTNAIGKLAANSGVDIGDVDITSIAAGDNNIGNVDVVTLPALAAGTNAIGKLAANSGVDIGDVTLTAGTASIGSVAPNDIDVTAHTNYIRKYYTSTGAATDGIIWSPAAGKRWHVVSMYLQTSAAATITLEDDKTGGDDPVWKGEFAANQGMTIQFSEHYPLASGEDAADLIITTSAGNIYVTVTGYEV